MALFHELAKKSPRIMAGLLVLVGALVIVRSASAASINLQTVKQRSRGDTYWRCSVYAQHNYPHIDFASTGRCVYVHVEQPKYTILSARRARIDTEFVTQYMVTGVLMHCYQRLWWKGHDNDIRIYKRSRQSCVDAMTG
jgi:hypothetical protein